MINQTISVSTRNLSLGYGAVQVLRDLNIDIGKGEFLVLLGSSGCGKSTLLNCIAGLAEPTEGQVFIGDRNVTWLEPAERGIGMVFQSYALYPQMTVRGNLEFGLKNARTPRDEIDRRVARAAEILQIGPLLDRKPAQLSGGQRQRVAIGRALVRDVDVFLFDEPLSNLDAKLRSSLRVELKRLHQQLGNTTMIYVTHDQVEAMTLADRIAIMKDGRIQQLGTPEEVYGRPSTLYVAQFIGSPSMNILKGRVADGAFITGDLKVPLDGYRFVAAAPSQREVRFGIRPEHVGIGREADAAPLSLQAHVELVEPLGSDKLIWTRVAGEAFCVRADGRFPVAAGETVRIGIDASAASLFDAETEARV
jgi:multiple sugar transport system ATP-binding protein